MFDSKNILLYPLSLVYGAVTAARNFLYNTGMLSSEEFDTPVICIGNITVGGTGKTPHTEYLIRLLKDNFKTAVLSRGYMRKSRGFRIASASSDVSEIGDEPMQIKTKFPGITVAVESNRVSGIRHILEEQPETEVIILDDGFQHRRLTPGFSILLTDFSRLIVRDHLLPYGSLRESIVNMRRANIILVTKTPPDLSAIQRRLIVKEINKYPFQNLYFTSLNYGQPVPVFQEVSETPVLNEESGVVLVTGIANPKPLYDLLEKKCKEIIRVDFPDHHNYSEKDLDRIESAFRELKSPVKYLITTEKDAVRLREFINIAPELRSAFFYIPVQIDFLNDDRQEFDNLIVDYVRKNKRNSRISQKEGSNRS
jgi:tetraacyldisaccharide 4'-kinase